MSTAAHLRLTNADMEAMPEDGNRYEVIDGEMYVSTSPSFFHQRVLSKFIVAFDAYLRGNPIGEYAPGVGVIFDDYNGVIPDLVFATRATMSKALIGGRFHAAPEIAIEILSPGSTNERRDRQVKRSLYDTRGVGEYWLVDPENRTVEVYRRDEANALVFDRTLQQTDNLTSAILPGFSIGVDTLFA